MHSIKHSTNQPDQVKTLNFHARKYVGNKVKLQPSGIFCMLHLPKVRNVDYTMTVSVCLTQEIQNGQVKGRLSREGRPAAAE